MVRSRLSAENFRQAVGTLKRFGERPQQAAWRVLVEGETLEMAAIAIAISKEAVRKSVGRVRMPAPLGNGGRSGKRDWLDA